MTLFELLLAITLFSTMLAAVAGLLRAGVQSQLTWGRALEPSQQMERAFHQLERDLSSTQPFFGIPVVGDTRHIEHARVETVAHVDGPSTVEWVRVSYHFEDDAGGLTLMRDESLWRASDAAASLMRSERLLHVTSGQLAFGAMDAQGHLIWTETWDGKQSGIPRLVKIDCALPTANGSTAIHVSRMIRNPAGNLPKVDTP